MPTILVPSTTEDPIRLSTDVSLAVPGLKLKEESARSPSITVGLHGFKMAQSTAISPEDTEQAPCYLTRIPMELLAEILLYMPSTKCILALARCNKYFCATLVKKSSVFIWRNVRASSKPYAIPDPTPNFTEPAYAVFIFDSGECEVRGTVPSSGLNGLMLFFKIVDMQEENFCNVFVLRSSCSLVWEGWSSWWLHSCSI